MKQDGSIALFQYWNRLRHGRPAPKRTEIEPADIKTLLADTFILERDTRGEAVFRLAGTRLCAVYGRELKGFSFPVALARTRISGWSPVSPTASSNRTMSWSSPSRASAAASARTPSRCSLLPLDGGVDNPRCLGAVSAVREAVLARRRSDRRGADRIGPRGRSRSRAAVPEEPAGHRRSGTFAERVAAPRGTTRPPGRAASATSSCSTAGAENKPFGLHREDQTYRLLTSLTLRLATYLRA